MKRTSERVYEQPWGLFAPSLGSDHARPAGASEAAPAGLAVADRTAAAVAASVVPLPRLDLLRNNVTGQERTGRILVKPHRCRCRTCPTCGPMYGRKVRSRLIQRSDDFIHPAMLTLTVEHSRFNDDPTKAFAEITQGRYIARLMKRLGVKRWVWVLEFQKSGWPHWHLLIDKSGGFFDLKKAWKWWGWNRNGWKLGGIDLGKNENRDGRHAVLYITKYLIKYPAEGFPAWLLDLDRRVRWVQASRAMGRIVSDHETMAKDVADKPDAAEAVQSLPEHHRTLRQRQRHCGQSVEFFRERVNTTTGTVSYKFCGRLERDIFDFITDSGKRGIQRDDDGRVFIRDPGNICNAMAAWCGVALKAGQIKETMRVKPIAT